MHKIPVFCTETVFCILLGTAKLTRNATTSNGKALAPNKRFLSFPLAKWFFIRYDNLYLTRVVHSVKLKILISLGALDYTNFYYNIKWISYPGESPIHAQSRSSACRLPKLGSRNKRIHIMELLVFLLLYTLVNEQ